MRASHFARTTRWALPPDRESHGGEDVGGFDAQRLEVVGDGLADLVFAQRVEFRGVVVDGRGDDVVGDRLVEEEALGESVFGGRIQCGP